MLNLKLLDNDWSKKGRVGAAKQKAKGQILHILMTKYVQCFVLKLQ